MLGHIWCSRHDEVNMNDDLVQPKQYTQWLGGIKLEKVA